MTKTFKEITEKFDDIDLMDEVTIFSISGTLSHVSVQLQKLECMLELINCSGQLILATDLYSSQYLFSDSLGVSPPL
ncbi:hypothetical protein NBRC116592_17200 [Colwellia sp. KU-HH00111]